jgi:hypothetical protein
MDFVAMEAPTARIAGSRKTPEFFNTPFRIVSSGQLLKADHLVEALAQRLRPLSDTLNSLLVNRPRYIHEHSICAPVFRVMLRRRAPTQSRSALPSPE